MYRANIMLNMQIILLKLTFHETDQQSNMITFQANHLQYLTGSSLANYYPIYCVLCNTNIMLIMQIYC